MRRKLSLAVSLCALFFAEARAFPQNGPDNDANGAPGYTHSAFQHGPLDSVNLYSGQLTIPLALGPSYPVGSKLRVQITLAYNSRATDFGGPSASWQQADFTYRPLVGNPSLGIGWQLELGAIKFCKHGSLSGNCYFAPDGSQHMFDLGAKTGDGTRFYLKGSGPFDMWDDDGNHYVFGWQVSGYDDVGLPEGYTHDFGRGRDGWYLTSVTDPSGNGYSVRYYDRATVPTPLWTYGTSTCPQQNITDSMKMRNPAAANTWIPRDVTLPSGSKIQFHAGPINGIGGMITSIDFPVLVDGVATQRTWTLVYEPAFYTLSHSCGPFANALPVDLQRIKAIQLPSDLTGSPAYQFSQTALLDRVTLPTGGAIAYCYGIYTLYHARAGSLQPGCSGFAPNTTDAIVTKSAACGVAEPEEPAPQIPGPCTRDNEATYTDFVIGVVRRRETLGSVQSDTTYVQYGFPFGESGTAVSPQPAQSLTVVVSPPTDKATTGPPDAGRRRAKAILFDAAASTYLGPGPMPYSVPGDRVGEDLEERVFETDPTTGSIPDPPCAGNAGTDAAFCASRALRVTSRTYEFDTTGVAGGNGRLQQEKTTFGASTCGGCPTHQVAFTVTAPDTWESNGRHYNTETHSGTLGGDARTTTTDWAPVNWTSGPPPGGAVLPSLANERTVTAGASSRDEFFEFDAGSGFLRGDFVYDSARDIALVSCRYDDGAGNPDKEFTRTLAASTPPPRTYCSANYPGFPGSVGTDGDAFGKDMAWQNGELTTARWVNGAVGTPTFNVRSYTRDATTGWVKTSADTSGRQTAYTYDSLGRLNRITPPVSAEWTTWICYEGPNATTAYRAAAAQTCPVPASNPNLATWRHFDYDGLGRTVRERRLQPGSSVVKRFMLYDGPGNAIFESEWVADAASESVTTDLATACVFSGGNFNGRARPSSAPGTYRMCWDPFGRPQQIVGSKHSSLVTVDRLDGTSWYSETKEAAQTYCVNGTFVSLQMATCSAGGFHAITATRRDAFGRVSSVIEPAGDQTAYTYDVNGKLTSVTQGAQSRSFGHDAAGFLRSESTPEAGAVTYDSIGSLGNVLRETRRGGLVLTRTFDFAGRLAEVDGAGNKYLVNCYDGASPCVDGTPGFGGGSYPGGKLTRRYGYNWIPTAGPVVDQQFSYSDGGGRLSRLVTAAGNGGLSSSSTQSWTYGNLGAVATHDHPRAGGVFTVAETDAAGLPVAITAAGQTVVPSASYNPSGGLASWTAGNFGTPIITTIAPDSSLLPRPASISNALWSSGAYSYDGAGNVLKMGSADVFTYDGLSRVKSAAFSGVTRSFAYDRYGNVTQSGSLVFEVDPSTNQLRPGNPGAPAYDPRGELTSYNGDATSYDSLGRSTRNSNAASDWVFLFDGAGERIARFPAKFGVLRREMARYVAEANGIAKGWTPPACVATFADVSCSDPDAAQIQLVYQKGITAGCNSNPLLYCPDATVTRAQMAVFLVKGYKPDGFAPPSCQGTFQDVACAGSYAAFAPWIEQLYRDGVTAGCSGSPLQFCPGSTVGEWETLVWLAKAPGAAPGSLFWGAYHPVPRGSIYTWRDQDNRVVTEAAGGTSGAATATLSVSRDNVFLGNLLVASYVASPAGWQYTASDHLGSPRVVFNQSGQLIESHRYWPYGEDTNTSPPNQHLALGLMERDDGAAHLYDHARTHDANLARFLTPDSVGGHPANPQSWNRYAYGLGNPLKYVDPDGNVAVGFTGLGNSPLSGVHDIASLFAHHHSIGQTRVFRHQDTSKAMAFVFAQLQANPEQPVVIFGHSRGAAAALELARDLQKTGIHVDLLLAIDPVMLDPLANQTVPSNVALAVNYWENLSSPLEGLYLTGDPTTTEIENRRLLTHHGGADDLVAHGTKDFEDLVARISEMMRRKEAEARKKACESPGNPCPRR